MPHLKPPKLKQPPWKTWDYLADKRGLRHTVYSVNGDQYTGEWESNLKHGKGTYIWKANGALYDGDWKKDKRNGYGTYSLPKGDGTYYKIYSGGWKDDKRHGYGTHFFKENEYYEGEYYGDQRSGWGRMYYADGSIYEGEWYDDKRNGQGMFRLPSENRYEGQWKDDKKNGFGKFYHLDTGQMFEGVWVDNVAKCGNMTDFSREIAPHPTEFPIPQIELENADDVMKEAENKFVDEEQ